MCASGLFRLTRLLELLEGELPDRLQHREALALSLHCSHEALVHQGGETVQDICCEIAPVTHLLGGLEAPTSGKHTEATEEPLLFWGQEAVAPCDRSPEGPLALGCIPSPRGQQLEAVAEAGEQGRR